MAIANFEVGRRYFLDKKIREKSLFDSSFLGRKVDWFVDQFINEGLVCLEVDSEIITFQYIYNSKHFPPIKGSKNRTRERVKKECYDFITAELMLKQIEFDI